MFKIHYLSDVWHSSYMPTLLSNRNVGNATNSLKSPLCLSSQLIVSEVKGKQQDYVETQLEQSCGLFVGRQAPLKLHQTERSHYCSVLIGQNRSSNTLSPHALSIASDEQTARIWRMSLLHRGRYSRAHYGLPWWSGTSWGRSGFWSARYVLSPHVP